MRFWITQNERERLPVGEVVRFNIRHVEPLLQAEGKGSPFLRRTEAVASISLALAYFVSITFYLRLLSGFVLRGVELDHTQWAPVLSTFLIVCVGAAGLRWGATLVERMEVYLTVKLAFVGTLLVGLGIYDVLHVAAGDAVQLPPPTLDLPDSLRVLGGVLIVVQGFETSRYMGEEFDAETRIRTMRWSQLLSGVIYLLFVGLALPTLHLLPSALDETAVIDLAGHVATVLPAFVVVAAVMSQLGAGLADSVGAAGLLNEGIGGFRIPTRWGFLVIAIVGIVLVWTADVTQIISLASRAFAFYYALQALSAVLAARQVLRGRVRVAAIGSFCLLGFLLLAVAVLAMPAG